MIEDFETDDIVVKTIRDQIILTTLNSSIKKSRSKVNYNNLFHSALSKALPLIPL